FSHEYIIVVLHYAIPIIKSTKIIPITLLDALPISSLLKLATTTTRYPGLGRFATLTCSVIFMLTALVPSGIVCEKYRPSSSVSLDRKSTRLNSSHVKSSYAVFCLKKKNSSHHVISY